MCREARVCEESGEGEGEKNDEAYIFKKKKTKHLIPLPLAARSWMRMEKGPAQRKHLPESLRGSYGQCYTKTKKKRMTSASCRLCVCAGGMGTGVMDSFFFVVVVIRRGDEGDYGTVMDTHHSKIYITTNYHSNWLRKMKYKTEHENNNTATTTKRSRKKSIIELSARISTDYLTTVLHLSLRFLHSTGVQRSDHQIAADFSLPSTSKKKEWGDGEPVKGTE
eukprot:gene7586-5348_t